MTGIKRNKYMEEAKLSSAAKKELEKLKVELNLMKKKDLIDIIIDQIDDNARLISSKVIESIKSKPQP